MSSIIFQDVNTIEYTSIKFDYLAINTNDILDQQENERLLVHQNDSNFSMIVLDTGLFLHTTRENAQEQEAKNYVLYADGNAYFTGTLTTSKINILNTDISDSNITLLINTINSNTGPFEAYKDPLYVEYLNYFTHYNINILDNSHSENARCNLHPLTINRGALYSAYNAQLAIGNNADNGKNNQSELLIGILGSDYKSPATIITNPGKSLEFYISQHNCNIDNLYNNAVDFPNYTTIPTLQIDTNNSVNINSSNAKILTYQHNEEITKLNVEGYGYIKELFVYDHTIDKPSHLDDIYFKKTEQNFYTSNIIPGIFEGNFGFNSNLIVNCNITTNDIDTSNLSSKIATINKIKTDEIDAKNIKIGISDHFYKDNKQLDIKRIDVKTILYSNHTIKANLLEESFYTETEIKDYIESSLINNGLISHIIGISDSTRIELINDTSNTLYSINIEYYNLDDFQSNLYYNFKETGSNIDLNHPVIDYCNVNVFNNLSNNFINTNSLCNITEITSNIYDILYCEGSNDTLQYYIKNSSNLKIDYENLSNLLYNTVTLDEDCNITSNIISNINISGFCNLYIEQYYSDDKGDLTSTYTIISNNEININDKYRIYLSNIVNDYKYTAEEIINSIYENGLNPYQYTYDFESNFEHYLDLKILESNEILNDYSNTLITQGFNNITEEYIINFATFKNDLNTELITLKDSIPSSNLLSFDTCVSKIEHHIDINRHSQLTSNLVYILDQFEYKIISTDQAVNRQLLNFVTNYDTSNIENDRQILIYSVNDGLTVNTNNNDVSIPNGLFSIGTDNTDGAMLSIRNCNSNNPEIVISEEDYKVQIGHNITNKETFTIKTNNIKDHNIELNAGEYGHNLFLKANTHNVGINTRNPTKSLDVNGDIISTNYYKRYLGEPKLIANFLDYDDHIRLEKNKRLVIKSKVEITNNLTINKIFKGKNELFNFNKKTYNNQHYLHSEVGCILMGEDVKDNIDNTAMLLQNTLNIERNNTIIRLLKANKWSQGDNPDPYTGIEFTRYPNDPYTGWYIHNKHKHDNFEIGYRNNKNNVFNLIKTSYSSGTDGVNNIEIGDGNGNNKIILNNKLEVNGDIDVIGGTYRLNGNEFSSNQIDLTTIFKNNLNVLNEPSFPNIVQTGDISMSSARRIINLVARGSSMFIGTYDSTNYNENNPGEDPGFTKYLEGYSIQHKAKTDISETRQFDANVNIVMPVANSIANVGQPPLLALKATHDLDNFGVNKNVKSGIRLAILNSQPLQPQNRTDYWNNENYADLYYKYFNDKCEFGIDFKYNNGNINTPLKITKKANEIYTTLSSVNNNDNSNAFFHILDNYKNSLLLLETTDNESINIKLKTQDNEWDIDTDSSFKIKHNDKYLTFNDNGFGINVQNPLASLDISNSNIYGITIKNNITTNDNTKEYHIDTDQIIELELISGTNSITFNLDKITTNHNTSNIETSSNILIEQTFNNCNFTGNDDINSKHEYSNIYVVSIDDENYNNESNFILNININSSVLNNYLSDKYSILSNVNLESNIYEASNDHYPDAIVKVETIYALNNLIISTISSSNYEIYLNGVDESPKLLSNYNICNIDFRVYHPENCNYDFTADVNLAIDYTINTNIISGIETVLEINSKGNDVYEINFLNEEYRSNVALNETVNLNYTCNIDGNNDTYNFNTITLRYYSIDKTCNVPIDIYEQQAHIKLTSDQNDKSYYITGYNSNFNINYQDDKILKEILNITNESKLTIDTLSVKNIECTGTFHNYESLIFCNENFNSINITSDHLYINTESDYSILINTNEFDNKNAYTSVIFGNKANPDYSNIIALQSTSTNSYLNITTNNQTDNYKIGKTDNNFNIIYTDSNILSIKPKYNEFEYYNFDFDDDADTNDDRILLVNEVAQTPEINTITTEYDYIFTKGRLKGIKNINYTSNLIFTEQNTPIISMNQDDITMHQRLICALGTTTSSDRRIKDNINKIENALDKIDKLDGVSYFNKLSKSNEIGLIAQDVKEIIPEVVVDSDIMGIQYGNMIGLLIEGIKELRKEIKNGSN